MWARIKAAFGHSTTILVARLSTLWGVITENGPSVAAQIADPSISDRIKQLLPSPEVGKWLIGIGILVELFRWRTARKPDA